MNLPHAYGNPPSAAGGKLFLEKVFDLGVVHFDSAALYGFGKNEQLLGHVLKPVRDLGEKLIAKDGSIYNLSGSSVQHYKPFGETIEEPKDNIGYTDHKFDTDLGLSYAQARYYDPVIGRFMGNDPTGLSNVQNFNRYAYANNNPYKYIDPDGREVRAIYKNGTLSIRDSDTGKRIVVSAESGGIPYGASIEPESL